MSVPKEFERKFTISVNSINLYHRRCAVYKFLQHPIGFYQKSYHFSISALILVSNIISFFWTFNEFSSLWNQILYGFDVIILIILTFEFSLRLWASECVSKYRGLSGKLRFFMNPFRVLDMIVIIASMLIVVMSIKRDDFIVPSLQSIRFFQSFKMLRVENRFRPWRVMASVFWTQREHLYITFFMSFLVLLLTSFMIYFVEMGSNPEFSNMGQSLWWTVITFTTIGYGDVKLITTAGKILASLVSVIGVIIFALPAGILSTGLALKVDEEQRTRQIGRRQIPAANLIQSRWKYHNLFRNSNSSAKNLSSFEVNIKHKKHLLTKTQINCLEFILKTKYFVCRQNFRKTLKPYDIRDILDQYSVGQLDLMRRIKLLNHKSNSIETIIQTSLRGHYESKNLINYRLSKLEEFMTETDLKLDQMLKIQNETNNLYQNFLSLLQSNAKV